MKLNLNCPTCGDGYGGTLGMKVFLQNCLAVGKWHMFGQLDNIYDHIYILYIYLYTSLYNIVLYPV